MLVPLLTHQLLDSHPVFHESAELQSRMLHLTPFEKPSKYIFGPDGCPIPYTDKLGLKDYGSEKVTPPPVPEDNGCSLVKLNLALNGMRRAVGDADKLSEILGNSHVMPMSSTIIPRLNLDVVNINPLGHFSNSSEVTLSKLFHAQLALKHSKEVVKLIKGDVEFYHWPAQVQTVALRPFIALKLYASDLLKFLTKCYNPVKVPDVFKLSKKEISQNAAKAQSSVCSYVGTRILSSGFL
jgi:hypothetical protein